MDSFTQVLLGIATAEVVAGKQLKNKTFLYGAILGTLPDLDILVGMFMNPVSGVAIHRGLSHSILFFACISPVIAWLITKLERDTITLKRCLILTFSCLFTHVILDAFTSWGTQILWPLPNRFALKTIFVIDPLYTIPLFISLIYVFQSKNNFLRHKYLFRGIFISSSYLLITCLLKLFVLNKFENALQIQNTSYSEIIVKPTAFNTILWNANIKVKDGYLLGDYSLFDTKPLRFKAYKTNYDAENKINTDPNFKKLVCISEGWYSVSTQDQKIFFNDLRFGLLNDNLKAPQFAFSYQFILKSDGLFEVVEVPKENRDGTLLLKKLWIRLQGN